MAEVATVYRLYGAAGTKTSLNGSVGRFAAQDGNPGLNNPCKVPPLGQEYDSFWVTDCLGITGDFNQVRDIYIHGDGDFARDWGLDADNGGAVYIGKRDSGDNGLPIDVTLHGSNQYAQATGTVGTKGNPMEHGSLGHPYYRSQSIPKVNIDTITGDAPLLVDSGPYADDFYSKGVVLQLHLVPTSTYGAKSPKSLIWTYNIF